MEKKIKITPNGPYEISPGIPMQQAVIGIDDKGTSEKWEKGKAYPSETEPYHICRCGHSKNKPYCDGTHNEIGFEGEEVASRAPYNEQAIRYEGETVDLLDNESLCASMRFCDRGPTVWRAAMESGNPENRALAIEEACACAAGRLTVVEKDGTAHEENLPQEISPIEDTAAGMRGPLWVKGGIPIEGADGQEYELRNRMTLCRCGESSNLPFCDTSHLRCPHMDGFDQ